MTPSTQPRSACQEKGNFGDGISSIFFICVRSWAAVSLPDWSGAKNLVRQQKKKALQRSSSPRPQRVSHFGAGMCYYSYSSINWQSSAAGAGKGCFVCLHGLLRESRMPHILELLSLFVSLFIYLWPAKGFWLYLPRAGEESEIGFSSMDAPGLCEKSRKRDGRERGKNFQCRCLC